MEFLLSQRVELNQRITEAGFDLREFEFRGFQRPAEDLRGRNGDRDAAVILHTRTDFYFRIEDSPADQYVVEYSPGGEARRLRKPEPGSWSEAVIPSLGEWLRSLWREIEAERLWAALSEQPALFPETPDSVVNTPFSAKEQTVIVAWLQHVSERLGVLESSLDPGQLAHLDSRLAYLESASGRVGRIDWRNLLVGTLVTLAAEAAFPPELVREAIRLLLTGLAGLFGGEAQLQLP